MAAVRVELEPVLIIHRLMQLNDKMHTKALASRFASSNHLISAHCCY